MRTFPTLLLAGLLTLGTACGCSLIGGGNPAPLQTGKPVVIHSLVILPATPPQPENGQQAGLRELRQGAAALDDLYSQYFEGVDTVTLLSHERQEALSGDFTGSRTERARLIGKKLGSDAVLTTVVERFSKRQGTQYGVSSPASVAFRFQLILVGSGKVACTRQFAETQQPLTANIFAFSQAASRGFKWVTARELAREGLHRELGECAPIQQLRTSAP